MNVVVCMKAVPSTTEVRMDPVTHTIVRDGREAVLNPFDTAALEVALQLKERLGAHVTVVSMGIPATERLLRDAIARGADEAILLSDRAFAGADTLATSYALSLAIERTGRFCDLVLCGRMAVDGDTAQIGPELAGIFNLPCVTAVSALTYADKESVTVTAEVDAGVATVEVPLPAVLTLSKDVATLRMPTIAGVLAAESAQVTVLDAASAGADLARCGLAGSPTQVVRSFVPPRSGEATELSGSASEQARSLLGICGEVLR